MTPEEQAEVARRLRARNLATLGVLIVVVVLFFLVSVNRMHLG